MSDFEFRLLGPLEVRGEQGPLQLGGPKQRALLALLLFDAGRAVTTDRLIDALWGEQPPRTAATSLQNFVSQLRKQLGPELLVTKPPGYLLRVDPDQVDVNRAEALLADSRDAPPEERAAKLRVAIALLRGAPPLGVAFEAFAQNEIGRLSELRLTLLEERIEADIETGRAAEVAGELEALVAEHPLRERFREQLMLALYRSGRQAEALEAFQQGRRVLVEELGIDPSPRLQQLHSAILRQESALEPARAAPAQDHFEDVAATILAGRTVPVLGADVAELTRRLAQRFGYPGDDGAVTLPRVAQYVAIMKGSGPLYDELHELLDVDLPPTAVHRFFASLPPLLRERGLSLQRRTVVLKLHGQVERTPTREWESFVVTEDDYIDYLAQTDIAGAVPVALAATLRRSHFLFLGYTMADWNLRVILHRLWGDEPLRYRSWAVQPEPKPLECEFWRRRDVDVVELSFEQYTETLARYLAAQPAGAAR